MGRNLQVRHLLAPLNERWEQTTEDINRLYQGLNRREYASSGQFGDRFRWVVRVMWATILSLM